MNIKNKIITALTLAVLVVPGISMAQTMSVAQLQAEIASLTAQLTQLEAQLATAGGTATWCYTFNNNLSIGMTGNEVTELQTALQKDGESVTVNGTFDDQTAAAVTSFQEKYASQILAPYGLNNGTGYAGKGTRAELNSLFGCTGSNPITPPIVVNPVAPTAPVACSLLVPYCPYGGHSVVQSNGCSQTVCNAAPIPVPTPISPISATLNSFSVAPSSISSGGTVTVSYSGTNLGEAKLYVSCSPGMTAPELVGDDCNQWLTFSPSATQTTFVFNNSTANSQQVAMTLYGYDTANTLIGYKSAYVNVAGYTPPASQASLNILSPASGEMVAGGSQYNVRWSETGGNLSSASYAVYLVGNGAVVQTIASGLTSSQVGGGKDVLSYTWAVPTTMSGSYQIEVLDTGNSAKNTGGIFTIANTQSPTITLFGAKDPNPVTGAVTISWQASAATDAALDMTCTPGSINFTTDQGSAPTCAKGGVWQWTSQTGGSIVMTPAGNLSAVTVPFTLMLEKNGVPTGQSQTMNVTFPAVTH
jgi:peptidoglycan hydrolase-like protein with peptidoglycan-binding domain